LYEWNALNRLRREILLVGFAFVKASPLWDAERIKNYIQNYGALRPEIIYHLSFIIMIIRNRTTSSFRLILTGRPIFLPTGENNLENIWRSKSK